jgi:hypothetical protein
VVHGLRWRATTGGRRSEHSAIREDLDLAALSHFATHERAVNLCLFTE